jgi:hypothetical protein
LAEVFFLGASRDGLAGIDSINCVEAAFGVSSLICEAASQERSFTMAVTKRQMMLVPEVNPSSFVFFFEKGNSGTSWSIRDYSIANRLRVYRLSDFQHTADHFFQIARHAVNAPAHDTNDLAFWHQHTIELNQRYGVADVAASPLPISPSVPTAQKSQPASSFPVLNLDQLMALPKGRKAQDMERILHSACSEDWVTWNFFQVLLRRSPADWWKRILDIAHHRNPTLDLACNPATIPSASFWNLVRSPEKYQEESRKRMMASHNAVWAARAASSDHPERIVA